MTGGFILPYVVVVLSGSEGVCGFPLIAVNYENVHTQLPPRLNWYDYIMIIRTLKVLGV